jgi:hypothetical protein
MKKLIVSLIAAGGLFLSGGAFAQGDGTGASGPAYGPVPGTPEYYGNSGGTLPGVDPRDYRDRAYAPYGPYVPHMQRDSRRAYPYARTRRDRDGDGISNRRDRYPDDPRRY